MLSITQVKDLNLFNLLEQLLDRRLNYLKLL